MGGRSSKRNRIHETLNGNNLYRGGVLIQLYKSNHKRNIVVLPSLVIEVNQKQYQICHV
jgi:hypothetical protein